MKHAAITLPTLQLAAAAFLATACQAAVINNNPPSGAIAASKRDIDALKRSVPTTNESTGKVDPASHEHVASAEDTGLTSGGFGHAKRADDRNGG
ncbi:hypothetical protein VTL71DRAFT_12984 [Oculimacula yallundae]|uniref:Lipoprotein n=1 Tax=Oculimacula yallundae TaxID=86028 RepID=A0ABR4CRP7_9HELO